MPAINQNFEAWVNRTTIVNIPITEADGKTPYTATTIVAAKWEMAVNSRSPTALLTKTSGSGGGIILTQDAISGLWTASITITPADWRPVWFSPPNSPGSINPGQYYHELSVTDNANDIVNVTIGILTLQSSLGQY